MNEVAELLSQIANCLETVPVCGNDNYKKMSNCIDALHNVSSKIKEALNQNGQTDVHPGDE